MTARDRMGYLFEEGTFSEIGMHVRHNATTSAWARRKSPATASFPGFGLVDGRPVACAASDFLAQGGSLGYMHAMKIADAQKYALKAAIPMVTVNRTPAARASRKAWRPFPAMPRCSTTMCLPPAWFRKSP